MALTANFHFFYARQGSPIAGIKVSELLDPYGDRKGTLPSLIVGPQLRVKSDKPVKWAKVIPPSVNVQDLPEYSRPRGRDDQKLMWGSVDQTEEGENKKAYLVSHRDTDGAFYVLVRTGLNNGGDGGLTDRLKIQSEHELKSHGSYSFDKASIRIAAADSDGNVSDDITKQSSLFTGVAAERMNYKAIGQRIPLANGRYCTATSYVLWRMPVGSQLLIRDITGKLMRLVSQKDQLRVVDADKYATFFEMLEDEHIKARRAEAAARKAAAAAAKAEGSATNATKNP